MTIAHLRQRLGAVAAAASFTLATSAVLAAPPVQAASVVVSPLPASSYSLSSYYGPRCMPTVGASTWHAGQDMGAPSGVRVNAIADGVVLHAGATSGFGQWVVVRHTIEGRTVSSVYGHVIDGDRYVRSGQTVRAGQRIGDVGSSGTSTAPHLHLEVWNGSYGSGASHTDPLAFLDRLGVDLAASATRLATRSVPSSCTYYTQTEVNLRSEPSTSAAVLTVAPRASTLTAKPGAGSGSWREVTYGSRTGWMSASLIGPRKPATLPEPAPAPTPAPSPSPTVPPTGTVSYVTAASLNLRTTPSTSSPVLAKLTRGTAVTHLGSPSNGWLQVKAGTRTGYVATAYLSTTKPTSGSTPAPKISYVTAASLNLRTTPSTSSPILAKLTRGTAVTHLGSPSNGWLQVKAGTRTGYVATAYLSTTRPR